MKYTTLASIEFKFIHDLRCLLYLLALEIFIENIQKYFKSFSPRI